MNKFYISSCRACGPNPTSLSQGDVEEKTPVFLTPWQCSARPRALLLNHPEALPLVRSSGIIIASSNSSSFQAHWEGKSPVAFPLASTREDHKPQCSWNVSPEKMRIRTATSPRPLWGPQRAAKRSRPSGTRRRAEACTEEERYAASTALKKCCWDGTNLENKLLFLREEK